MLKSGPSVLLLLLRPVKTPKKNMVRASATQTKPLHFTHIHVKNLKTNVCISEWSGKILYGCYRSSVHNEKSEREAEKKKKKNMVEQTKCSKIDAKLHTTFSLRLLRRLPLNFTFNKENDTRTARRWLKSEVQPSTTETKCEMKIDHDERVNEMEDEENEVKQNKTKK